MREEVPMYSFGVDMQGVDLPGAGAMSRGATARDHSNA